MAETVREVMRPSPVFIDARASLESAAQVMRTHGIGDVLVTEGDRIRGILTDRDIVVRALADGKHPAATFARDCCTEDVRVIDADAPTDEAIDMMRRHAIRRLPVVNDDRLVGVVSIGDLAIAEDPRSALADISAADPNV